MKSIYIAGCGGMLGEAFYKQFKNEYNLKCTDIDVNEKWIDYLNFIDLKSYCKDVSEFKPDYLFHIGALTDLEYCELHSNDTYLTNTIGVENAVFIANKFDIPLLYISTAGIFDGAKDIYDDWDSPNPIGSYARSKWAGEKFVQDNANTYLICRPGWMMGGGPKKDKKFINKILKQIRNGNKKLFIVNDRLGTPTYTHDFCKNVQLLLKNEMWGLYNMVCSGLTSRIEVAEYMIETLNINNNIKIQSVSSDFFKKKYFVTRPASERLINRKLNLRKMNLMRDWKIALKEYLNDYYKNYI